MAGLTVRLLWKEENHRSCWNTSREDSSGHGGERSKLHVERTRGRGGPEQPGQVLGRWQEDHPMAGPWKREAETVS